MLSKMLLKQRPFGKKIESFKTKTASEIPPYNVIAEETGLKGNLTAVWGEDKATTAPNCSCSSE